MQSAFRYAANFVVTEIRVVSKRIVKVRDLVRQLEENGWKLDRIRGSHRQYRHAERPELRSLTVAGHLSEDIPKGTLAAILKQAGLKK
ncbi:MAG TPA: type II toxin-antitoxin system HicA family toxin [Bryobacteraceae bacterium]